MRFMTLLIAVVILIGCASTQKPPSLTQVQESYFDQPTKREDITFLGRWTNYTNTDADAQFDWDNWDFDYDGTYKFERCGFMGGGEICKLNMQGTWKMRGDTIVLFTQDIAEFKIGAAEYAFSMMNDETKIFLKFKLEGADLLIYPRRIVFPKPSTLNLTIDLKQVEVIPDRPAIPDLAGMIAQGQNQYREQIGDGVILYELQTKLFREFRFVKNTRPKSQE